MVRYLNLGILAHVDAGKTTLTEQLLHKAGVVENPGSVDQGTTQTDSLALEQQRGITIKSAVVSFEIDDTTVNLIDTPGHPDFIAEVERALAVLDGAVLVVSAVEGVQAQTRILIRALMRLQIPSLIFVNKIDRVGARSTEVLNEIEQKLEMSVVAMGTVENEGTRSAGFRPLSADDTDLISTLSETLSENDDELLLKLLEDQQQTYDDVENELKKQVRGCLVHPVFFGTAMYGVGIDTINSAIADLLPSTSSESDSSPEESDLSALVFKIDRVPTGEKVALTRVFDGLLANRSKIEIEGLPDQKITGMEVFENGSSQRQQVAPPRSIAKLWGLSEVRIGDIIGKTPSNFHQTRLAKPTFETSVVAKISSDRPVLHRALTQLSEQDPLINLRQSDLLQEMYLSLNGEVQKEVIQETLRSDFGIDVEFSKSSVICVEQPSDVGSAVERIGKAGNPFLAALGVQIAPAPPGSGISVRFEIETREVPLYVYGSVREFEKTIDALVRENLTQGLSGWEVIDCDVTITESDYASPSTTHSDFKYLTPLVVMRAIKHAGTTVCEPVHSFVVDGPVEAMSSVVSGMGRLNATVNTSATDDAIFTVEGEILASKTQELQISLMSVTRGEGTLDHQFSHYAPIRGKRPTRPRTDLNPLNFKEYMSRIAGRF